MPTEAAAAGPCFAVMHRLRFEDWDLSFEGFAIGFG